MLGSWRHSTNKASSSVLFSSDNDFPSANLTAKKLKHFINDSHTKENENNVNVTGWMLTS